MHLNATLKGFIRAFIFTIFSCLCTVGLPAADLNGTHAWSWLQAYAAQHPNAPVARTLPSWSTWLTSSARPFAEGPLWSSASSTNVVTFGVACLTCSVTDAANAVDGNANTAATMQLPVGAIGGVGLQLTFPGTYQSGDAIALDLEIPDQNVSLSLLSAISVTTFNGGISNNDEISLNNNVATLDLLGLGVGSTPKFRVVIPASHTFDQIQINFSALISAFSALRVYEATAFQPAIITPATPATITGSTVALAASLPRIPGATFQWFTTPEGGTAVGSGADFTTPVLNRTTTFYVQATNPADGLVSPVRTPVQVLVGGGAGLLWMYGDRQASALSSGVACVACTVDNPENAVDADTTTASTLSMPVGALGTVGQFIAFPGNYKAGDQIVLDLDVPAQTLSAAALSAIQITTYSGVNSNNDPILLNNSLVELQASGLGLGNTPKVRVVIPTTKDFNGVRIDLGTAFTAFGALRIYEAAATIPVTATAVPPNTTAGNSVSLTASIDPRVSNPTFRWYTTPSGGTPVSTGNPFTTPALARTTTFYAEAYDPNNNLSSYVRTPVTVKVAGGPGTIWSYGQDQESPITGGVACAGCTVADPLLASDGDTTTASTLTVPLGLLSTVGQLVKLPGVYEAGDSIVLFLEAPTENLAAVVLPQVKVTTYQNSIAGPAVSNNDAVTLNSPLVKLQVLGGGLNNARKFKVTIPATKTFDGVQVDFGGLVGVSGSLKLYEVATMIPVTVSPSPAKTAYNTGITLTPSIRISNPTYSWYTTPTGGTPVSSGTGAFTTPALTRNTTYYVEAKDPAGTTSLIRTAVPVTIGGGDGPLWTYGTDQTSPVTGGVACVLCVVENPQNAIDGDITTASRLVLPLGVATSVGQQITFPGVYHSGDSIILMLGTKGDQLVDASVLGNIGVTTSLNGVSNNDRLALNAPLIQVNLLSKDEVNKFRVAIPVTKDFDAATIDLSSLVAADNSLYIYEAAAMQPVTVSPSSVNINAGETTTLTASLPDIPGAVFNWYTTPTGGAPIHTGSTFTTPPLYDTTTYYVEAVSPTDGLVSIVRTGVDVNVIPAINNSLDCGGATTQNNGVIGLCILCGVTNAGNAVDASVSTASDMRISVGLVGGVYQDLIFPKSGKAGDSIRIGLGTTTGLLDATLLAGLSVGTGNGARPADADMIALNPSLLSVRLLSGVQQTAYTFVATKDFDRIEIRLNGLLAALSSINVYYAKVVTPLPQVTAPTVYACSGTAATLGATASSGYTLRWYTTYTGGTPVGYGTTFTTPVITKDTTYFVEAAGNDSCGSEIRIPVQVKLGLPGVNVTPATATVMQGATPTFNVVSPNATYQYNWYDVPTGGTPVFIGSQFTTPSVLANVTYYVEAVSLSDANCKSLRTPVSITLNGTSGPTPTGDIDCGGATSQLTTTSGICIGCYVEKQDSAVDNSTQTASVMHTIVGVGSYVQQSLIFPAPGVKGDRVRIKLGFTTGLANLSALSAIQISSSNSATSNSDEVTLGGGLLNLELLNGNRDAVLTFVPGANFDRVNIKLNGLLTALTALKVYSAEIFADTPTVEKDTVYACAGSPVTLRATGPGTSFRWYNQPTGGTALATGATYTVTPTTNAIYYVEGVSGSGCTNPDRKAVYVMVGLPQPLVNPATQTINAGQTATFNVISPNPAYEYNWYDAPAGGTLIKANSTTYTTGALTAAAIYYVEVRDPVNNCTSATRTPVRVDINLPTEPTPCSYATQQQSPIISGVCLLCSVSNPALAVDQNANSASTINATLSAAGYIGQLLRYTNTYPAGDSITLDLEVPGKVADVTLLGGIRVETYNGTTANGDGRYLSENPIRLTLLATGNKFRVTIPTTKTFNGVMVSINGLVTAVTSVNVYFAAVVTPRPDVSASATSVCSGNTATLTATSANGADIAWYTDAVGGTAVATGTSYTTPVLNSTITYYAEVSRFGCANPTRVPVMVSVGNTPAAPTAAAMNICAGDKATLLATAPAGATYRWYTAATGGTLLASTSNYTTNALTADTAFYVEADNNGCISTTRTRVVVTVNAVPTGLTVTPMGTSISSGQSAIFTAHATGTNLTYKWYNAAGDSIFAGAVFNTGPLTTTSTYTVEAVNAAGCKTASRVSVTATVIPGNNDIPCDAATAETNSTNGICIGCFVENPALSVDNSTASSSTLHVILGLTGGYVQQALIFPQISELNDSVQISLSFTGSLADVGLLSTIQIGSFNGATSNNDFVALNNAGVNVSLLSGNSQALVGFKPKALFDRIVVRLNSGLATALSAVNIHYASRLVGLPVTTNDTICAGNRATLLATGPANVSFRWYTTAVGGTSFFTGTSYQTPALNTTTTYYVEAVKTSLTCPNLVRVPVTAVVDPVPDAPALDTTAITVCSGSTATFNVKPVTGVTYRWYSTLAGGTAIHTGNSFTTPALNTTTVYYVEASNAAGCSNTTRTTVTANVITQPALVTVTPDNAETCAGSSVQLVASTTTTGVVFRWYTTATGGTPVFEGATFNTPVLNTTTTYYVEAAAGICASATRTAATVTVNAIPNAPTVNVPAGGAVVSGQTATLTVTPAAANTTYNWYTDAAGGTPVFTGNPFVTPALTSDITYYVEAVADSATCGSQRTAVALTVTVVPNTACDFANAQTNSTTAVCVLCSVQDAANTTDANTDNYSLLSVPLAAGSGSVQQSLIFPNTAAAGDIVRIVLELPAQVLDASLSGAIEISSFNGATSNNDALLLNSSNLSVSLLSSGNKFVVAFAPGGTYDRVQVKLRGGVISALVNLRVYYASRQVSAPVVAVRSVTVCRNQTATLTATASAVASIEWYDASGTKVGDGPTFTTPAITANTTYYAQAVRTSNGCANPNRVSVNVNVVAALATPTVNSPSICSGNTATLTATVTGSNITTRWYSAPTGGTLLHTGTTYVTNALTADTAFYVETSNSSCTLATRVKATVTVGAGAPTPTLLANNVDVCAGQQATFTVTSSTTGITYNWYTTLTGGTSIFTGPVYTTGNLTTSTVYYVEAINAASGCGTGSARVSATANVALNPNSPVVTASSVEVCTGQDATLSVTTPQTGVTYQWYDAATAGTLVGSGATITIRNVTANADYYVEARNTSGCVNTGGRVKVSVVAVPSPGTPTVTAASVNVCAGNTAQLSVQNPNAAYTYRWYNTATGGTSLGSGTTFTTPVINADADYYVEATNGNCSSTVRARVSVIVASTAPTPTLLANSVDVCAGQTATFTVTSSTAGITYNWYTTATGGTSIFTGPTFTTGNLSASATYYVEGVNTGSGCNIASARVAAAANVVPAPNAPTVAASNVDVCTGQDAVLSVTTPQTGVTYNWYNAATAGTMVGSGTSITISNVTANATYYVEAVTSGGCVNIGGRTSVTVTAVPSPTTPTVTAASVSVCSGSTVDLSVQNPDPTFTYRWYSTATGGTSLGTGTTFTTPVLTADATFYVEATNGNCSSAVRAQVSVTVSNRPPTPTLESNDVTTCSGSSATLRVVSTSSGVDYNWYTVATGGTPVFTGATFTTPALSTTTTYYVEAVSTLTGCGGNSTRVSATVTVGSSPDAPTLVSGSVKACSGNDATLSILNPQTGVTYQWYDAATGGTLVHTGTSYTVTAVTADATYYVQTLIGTTCVSATRTAGSIVVDNSATTPDVVSTNVTTCVGGTATLSVQNPNAALTYRWYDAPSGGNLLSTGPDYTTSTLNANTTFYVEALNSSGCSSLARRGVTVTITNTIDAPLASSTTICSGNPAVLAVTSPVSGISYRWYDAATGGTLLFTGANFTTQTLTANATYYVEAATGGCISASRTPVSVTVNSTPAAPAVANASVTTCANSTAVLSVQNPNAALTYQWFTTATGGTAAGTGSSFTTPAITGTTMFYVEAQNPNGCPSNTRTAITVSVGTPGNDATVTGNDAGICPGETATLTATSSTAGATYSWFTTATGGTAVATGASFTTPAISTNTTYYVEVASTGGCTSGNRVAATVTILEALDAPIVSVDTANTTTNAVTFTWDAVAGATGYEVTTNNGTTFTAPSSGSNGTSHTVYGLNPGQPVTIQVRALGSSTCQTSALSNAVTGEAKNPQGNRVFVPNVFTPNGDGFNDIHYVYGNTVKDVVIRYYNQYGQLIYETKDQTRGWDGTMSGRQQPVGVYIYVLRATLQDGTIVNRKGTVTIVR